MMDTLHLKSLRKQLYAAFVVYAQFSKVVMAMLLVEWELDGTGEPRSGIVNVGSKWN